MMCGRSLMHQTTFWDEDIKRKPNTLEFFHPPIYTSHINLDPEESRDSLFRMDFQRRIQAKKKEFYFNSKE